MPDGLQPAFDALDDCRVALTKLDTLCCEPGRSPSMAALDETIEGARARIAGMASNGPDGVLVLLEDAGAQVGRLQVGCCAPGRLPLYARLLEGLTTAQLAVNAATGRGH